MQNKGAMLLLGGLVVAYLAYNNPNIRKLLPYPPKVLASDKSEQRDRGFSRPERLPSGDNQQSDCPYAQHKQREQKRSHGSQGRSGSAGDYNEPNESDEDSEEEYYQEYQD